MSYQQAPLTVSELAESGLDLTSWVLQDDLYKQDFCQGAKETHSHPAVGLSDISVAGLSSSLSDADYLGLDSEFKLEDIFPSCIKPEPQSLQLPADLPMLIDDQLDIEAIMKEEILQQQKQQQLNYLKQQEQQESFRKQREQELIRFKREQEQLQQQKLLQKQQLQQQKLLKQQQLQQQQQLLQQESIQPAMEIIYDPVITSSPDGSFSYDDTSSGPSIISVPISEALYYQGSSSPTNQYLIESPSYEITEIIDEQPEPPKPIVINVKRVSIPSPRSTGYQSDEAGCSYEQPAARTLKETVETSEADDFINELINSPVESVKSSEYAESVESYQTESGLSMTSPTYSDYYPESPAPGPRKGTRSHPYSAQEKKLRKKEQNKRAALRYRQKKKEEEDIVANHLKKEKKVHEDLMDRYDAVHVELKVMRGLARRMLAAQGIKLPS